ncbi:MAG: hypothetical protein ACFFD9_10250 [Candidatus Thorarchaeota archaeon]
MSKPKIDDLMYEIKELRKTVLELSETVRQLNARMERATQQEIPAVELGEYTVISDQGSYIEGDTSWIRLVKLLQNADHGLTAAELASMWGKSRSRTSEVLNRLVLDGQLVKYRDGRTIRFRPL